MNGLLTFTNYLTNNTYSEYNIILETKGLWSGYIKKTKTPHQTFNILGNEVYIEGCIYNMSDDDIRFFLVKILEEKNIEHKKNIIENFVNIADGEFIIQVFNSVELIGFLILDKYARIPLYYTLNDREFVIARDLNKLLELHNKIELNIIAIWEYIMFEFFLGNKTFYKNVFRVEPYDYIEINLNSKKLKLNIFSLAKLNYDNKNWKSKKLFINQYYKRFEKAVKDRLLFFSKNHIKIANLLSGGYDSRAVFGQLNKENAKVSHYTFEYIQDESEVARKLMHIVAEKNNYEKLSFSNIFNIDECKKYVYNCQGLSTLFMCQICTEDNNFLSKKNNIEVVWGGFGGEYIRHPYKIIYKNLYKTLDSGLLEYDLYKFDSIFKNNSGNDFRKHLQCYFDNYREKTEEGKLKHFYNEYYRHRVGNGEDLWGRNFFWTVNPMMASSLIDLYTEMPIKYASYNTFKKFLKKINQKLIKIEIYNDKYRLDSFWFFIKDFKLKMKRIFKVLLYNCIKNDYYLIIKLYKKIRGEKIKSYNSKDFENNKKIPYYEEIVKSELISQIFNIEKLMEYIKSHNDYKNDKLFSCIIYFLEIEKLYYSKLK